MTLKDKIEDEMVVDTESLLEKEFERAKMLFDIFEDGSVVIADEFKDSNTRNQILIHLIAQQYLVEANRAESPGVPTSYFYDRFDKDDSTIRHYLSDLADDEFVRKNDDGDRVLVVERLADAIDRILAESDNE